MGVCTAKSCLLPRHALLHSSFIAVKTPVQSFLCPLSANIQIDRGSYWMGLISIQVHSCVKVHIACSHTVSLLCTRPKWSGQTLLDGRRDICTSFLSPYLNPGVLFCRRVKKRKDLVCTYVLCQKVAPSVKQQTLWE